MCRKCRKLSIYDYVLCIELTPLDQNPSDISNAEEQDQKDGMRTLEYWPCYAWFITTFGWEQGITPAAAAVGTSQLSNPCLNSWYCMPFQASLTAKTQYQKFETNIPRKGIVRPTLLRPFYVFPEKELQGLSPNFYIYVSVSDLYMYSRDRSAYSAAWNMWTDPGNI